MNRIVTTVFVCCTAWLWLAAQQSLPDLFKNDGNTVLQGRIVLYDWGAHETTSGDDFVVKTADSKTPYARVIYKPFWGFDAPPATQKDVLDRWAFVGHGITWGFAVHPPQSVEEKAACSSRIVNYKYEDESGTGEIPRFLPTPGADTEKLPAPQTLPCFILKRDGLTRVRSDSGSLTSATDIADRIDPATGAMLLALLPTCPICEKSIQGHLFAQIASTIATGNHKTALARLFRSVRGHEWERLAEFKEWDSFADNLVVHIIKGDHHDGIVLVIKDVVELYESNDLILLERITEADIAAIAGQLQREWQQI